MMENTSLDDGWMMHMLTMVDLRLRIHKQFQLNSNEGVDGFVSKRWESTKQTSFPIIQRVRQSEFRPPVYTFLAWGQLRTAYIVTLYTANEEDHPDQGGVASCCLGFDCPACQVV